MPSLPEFPKANLSERGEDHYWEGYLVLRSPLIHSDGEALGNVRLFRSQKVVCADGQVRRLPKYSGNAFRGMLRDIAARQLMETLEVQLPPAVFHFLTSGGALTGGDSSRSLDVGQARLLRRTIPMVGVWGGAVGSQILEGKLKILDMMPICQETIHLLPRYCQDAPSAKLSIRDLRHMEFGTRRDDAKKEANQPYLCSSESDGEKGQNMIYENETLAPGTCLRFGFHLDGATRTEWNCFANALLGWLREPFLGGSSRAGYGEVAAPSLYRARRELTFHSDTSRNAIVDLRQPLATIESEVDVEDRLSLAAETIHAEYVADVNARRNDLIAALGSVV